MRGLLTKIFIEVRWPVLLFGIGLALVMSLLTAVLPKVLGDIHRVFEKLPFVKPLVTALLGVDPGSQLSAQMTQAFLWVHPSVLSVIWAHEVIYCTRLPAGEIDRGTIDFLLGLPVSRWKVYCAESIGWLISGVFVTCLGVVGHLLTSRFAAPEMRPTLANTVLILLNLLGVYAAIGSMAFLVSSWSDRRNRAIGGVFAILLFSFLVNFIAQFWEPAKSFAWVSVMEYYRPAIVLQSGEFPWSDMGVLLGISLFCWLAGGMVFCRRSICTV